jgi:chromosome transmission fidelity protein 4
VTCLDVSQKGHLICAGSADMTFKVIERDTFKDVLFDGHSAPVLSVAFSPAADLVASSSCDGTVRLWNVADKRCVAKWDKVLICSFYTRAEKYS